MRAFLDEIAPEIIELIGPSPEDLIVIVPSRQTGKALQKSLSAIVSKVFWSPQILTLPEFVQKQTDRPIASRLQLLALLFESYGEVTQTEMTFEEFSSMGETLLHDFDDVLLSQARANVLFDDLRNIKDIEDWSFALDELSNSQENFLHLWRTMGQVFDAFVRRQNETGLFSYSLLISNLSSDTASIKPIEKLVYIAGQPLKKAERNLLKFLQGEDKLHVFSDEDDFYKKNTIHEASIFLKRNLYEIKVREGKRNYWTEKPKSIAIHQSNTFIGESAKTALLLIDSTQKTGIVFTHKDQLVPLLEYLPEEHIDNLSISGGYPIHLTPLFQLIGTCLDMHLRNLELGQTHIRWTHKEISQLIHSRAISILLGKKADQIEKYMIQHHMVYLGEEELKEICEKFGEFNCIYPFLYRRLETATQMSELINQLLLLLDKNETDPFKKSSITEAAVVLDKCMEFCSLRSYTIGIGSLKLVWSRIINEHFLAFTQSADSTITILPLRESLGHDFDRLIVVGANEGDLPGAGTNHSFIPRDIRLIFGLSATEETEQHQAYLFYRMLQRPEEIHVFHSTISKDFGNNEQSRFITQLQFELKENAPLVSLVNVNDRFEIQSQLISKEFDQNEKSVETILAYLQRGLSASALASYLNCPLDFYYKYVLRLGERDAMEETITSSTLGEIAHAILEEFYTPFLGSFPPAHHYDAILGDLENIVKLKYGEIYSLKQIAFGRNYLSVHVLCEMLRRFLQTEKSDLVNHPQRKILFVEKEIILPIEINFRGENIHINMRGKLDRIDQTLSGYTIIDFKTGKVEAKQLSVSKIVDAFKKDKNKIIQLMTYILLMSKGLKISPENIEGRMISLQRWQRGNVCGEFGDKPYMDSDDVKQFEQMVQQTIEEMLAPRSFGHNQSNKYCEYCLS